VTWTAPQDLAYDPAGPFPLFGGVFMASPSSRLFTFLREEGFHAATADATVRFLSPRIDENQLQDAIERDRTADILGSNW
jgi:hypothetical protein